MPRRGRLLERGGRRSATLLCVSPRDFPSGQSDGALRNPGEGALIDLLLPLRRTRITPPHRRLRKDLQVEPPFPPKQCQLGQLVFGPLFVNYNLRCMNSVSVQTTMSAKFAQYCRAMRMRSLILPMHFLAWSEHTTKYSVGFVFCGSTPME